MAKARSAKPSPRHSQSSAPRWCWSIEPPRRSRRAPRAHQELAIAARGYAVRSHDAADVATLVDRVRREPGRELACAGAHGRWIRHERTGCRERRSTSGTSRSRSTSRRRILTSRAFLPMLRRARGSIVFFASAAGTPWKVRTEHVGIRRCEERRRCAHALHRRRRTRQWRSRERARADRPFAPRRTSPTWATTRSYIEREQVADVVTFLCSSAASAITGELLPLS